MRKYYFKDSAGQQQGPLKLDKLKGKGITASTPVWYDGLEKWTTADQVDELKALINPPVVPIATPVTPTATEPVQPKVEEKPAVVAETPAPAPTPVPVPTPAPEPAPVAVAAVAPAVAQPAPAPVKAAKAPRKKGPAAVTYVLSLLVLGGVGYFVYQDMEKNKSDSTQIVLADTASNTANTQNQDPGPTTTDITPTTTTTDTPADTAATTTTTTTTTEPTTTTVTPTSTTDPAAAKKAEEEKKKQAVALAKKKADEEKKKQLAAEAKKKEEEKKKQAAAQAAREADMRNNWPRYITIGQLNYKEDDGIKSFPITVNNGMPVSLDRVTLRVDYLKKEGKVVGTETIVMNGIGAKASQDAQAKGNKKAKRVNVYIIAATSRQLHFCYPVNSGNASDPYYCD